MHQAGRINALIDVNEEEAKKIALACAIALKKLNEEFLPHVVQRKAMHACEQSIETINP